MKQHIITTYSFDELSDKAKETAIQELYDINVDHGWWQFVYDDAEDIGLKLTEFDLDRHRHAKGEFMDKAVNVAERIKQDHGKDTDTYKTANDFLVTAAPILKIIEENEEPSDGEYNYDILHDAEEEFENAVKEFLRSLLEDYSIILQKEYEYLTSEEVIIDTIRANDYDFTENGKLF